MVGALALFEMRVHLRRSATLIALGMLIVVPLLTLWLGGAREASAVFGYGYLLSLAFRLTLGMAEDRQSGQDDLMANFAAPQQRITAKLVALLVRELALAVTVAAMAMLVWQDARLGLWYAVEFTLVALLVVPLAAALELTLGLRAPGAVALLVGAAAILTAARFSDAIHVLTWIGLPQSAGAFAALGRLAWLALCASAVTLLIAWLWVLARREARA
jgi:hypothetical protein